MLIAAFSVVLLASVSTTMASLAAPLPLVEGLQRDLAAIRVQLERTDPEPFDIGRQSAAFNADLGDGGMEFRHRSMATILRSAKRRLESLMTGYRTAGDAQRAALAESAQLELQELHGRVHYLGNAEDTSSSTWLRKRLEAEALIDRLQGRLAGLLPPRPTKRSSGLG